jgi:hypothetical protein
LEAPKSQEPHNYAKPSHAQTILQTSQQKKDVTGLIMFAHAISFSFSSDCDIFSASDLSAVVTKTMTKLLINKSPLNG